LGSAAAAQQGRYGEPSRPAQQRETTRRDDPRQRQGIKAALYPAAGGRVSESDVRTSRRRRPVFRHRQASETFRRQVRNAGVQTEWQAYGVACE